MAASLENVEAEMRLYAACFLRLEYGFEAEKKLDMLEISAVDAYDTGGVSEATDRGVKIAAKRDVAAGKLTGTSKLILRHELGHILDRESPLFPEFDEEIQHEKIAWTNAKPKNAAENWYKNLSVRTHIDPLKMAALGFPRPELKVSAEKLERGTRMEMKRMGRDSVFVDRNLAERFALLNLVENSRFYDA